MIQRLQSAPLVIHSSLVLTAQSEYAQSEESELIPALHPLLFLSRGGGGERQDVHKLFNVQQSSPILTEQSKLIINLYYGIFHPLIASTINFPTDLIITIRFVLLKCF